MVKIISDKSQTQSLVDNMLSQRTVARTEELMSDSSLLEKAKMNYMSHWAPNPIWEAVLIAATKVYDVPVLLPLIPRRCDIQTAPKTHIFRILYAFDQNCTYNKLALATGKKEHTSVINLLWSFESQVYINKNYKETHRRILEILNQQMPLVFNTNTYLNGVYRKFSGAKNKEIYNHDEYTLLYYAQMGSSVIRAIDKPQFQRVGNENSTRTKNTLSLS